MPEFYIEPLTDRRVCFKCNKTGKKKLFKCGTCEAITYCSVECQREDWTRHEWNCVPVMVTEIPGKGRGLVAARDIKMGEQIFKEKPAIQLCLNDDLPMNSRETFILQSLKDQIENLPEEAKLQFFKLKPDDDTCVHPIWNSFYQTVASRSSPSEYKALKLFVANSVHFAKNKFVLLFLNIGLVNHSCAPNAVTGCGSLYQKEKADVQVEELRASKNIAKGEEITTCYYSDVKKHGSIQRKRKTGIKKGLGFDCKCPVCLGLIPCQEKILKKLIELHNKLDPTPSDWKRDAGIRDKIADLTPELYMGQQPLVKLRELEELAFSAYRANDHGLVMKAMDKLKQLAEDIKLEELRRKYDDREREID